MTGCLNSRPKPRWIRGWRKPVGVSYIKVQGVVPHTAVESGKHIIGKLSPRE
jgi:hypothetical protein